MQGKTADSPTLPPASRILTPSTAMPGLNGHSEYKKIAAAIRTHAIEDADLLLFRRRGLVSIAGRGMHSHAATAVWWRSQLFCVEVREWHGGRAVTLASQVKKFPGLIDVFRRNAIDSPRWDREKCCAVMRELAGSNYGYAHVLAASTLHLPGVRLLVSPDLNDESVSTWPPFCSEARAYSDRLAGFDPVPHLADRLTEPTDLARSAFYEYRFTLMP